MRIPRHERWIAATVALLLVAAVLVLPTWALARGMAALVLAGVGFGLLLGGAVRR